MASLLGSLLNPVLRFRLYNRVACPGGGQCSCIGELHSVFASELTAAFALSLERRCCYSRQARRGADLWQAVPAHVAEGVAADPLQTPQA